MYKVLSLTLLAFCSTSAFQVSPSRTFLLPHHGAVSHSTNLATALHLAKKSKGFDKSAPKPKPKPKEEPSSQVDVTSTSAQERIDEEEMNAGQKALAKLRSQQQSSKDEELRQIKEIRSIDEFIRDDPTAAVIPEKVAMRMGSRMLPFVGIPLFGTMGAFVAFWYFRTYKNVEFETNVVAFTTIGLLVVGLLGITYSVMSASWDPEREGSTLGAAEFSENLDSIRQGLKRSRENLVLREKMAGLPEEEIEAAIATLDKRDERERMKKMSLEDKLKKELD